MVLDVVNPGMAMDFGCKEVEPMLDEGGCPWIAHRLDLSNRPGRPFWPVARPEKKRAGLARPSTVAGRAGTAQKERAVLGQGCQPACHAGRPVVPTRRASLPCRPTEPAHRAGPPSRPTVPTHRAGPPCRPTVPAHPLYQFSFFI